MAKSPLANKEAAAEGMQEAVANAAANVALEQMGQAGLASRIFTRDNADLNEAAANAAGAFGAAIEKGKPKGLPKGEPKGLPSDRSKAINDDGEIINAITGLTEDQQIAANLAEKEKQSNNADLFGAYKNAQNALRTFENANPGAPFGDFVDEAMKNKYLELEAARAAARKAYTEIQ